MRFGWWHAAAPQVNSWLNAFTLWRRAQGLPATAIARGAWAKIGRATALAEGADVAIAPDEGAYALEALLRHDRAYTGYPPITGTPKRGGHKQTASELNELPPDEWPIRLRRLLSDEVSLILRRSIDPDRPLAEYGVDSLGALELRTRIESETGVRLASSDIATTSIRDLAALLCVKLAPAEAA